jgi:Tfp pilus assembly protein FimT
MKKLGGFSVIELLIIISMVAVLLVVAAPSFYGLFKNQFLQYNTQALVQNLREIQADAFVKNMHYKIEFNSDTKSYRLFAYSYPHWGLLHTVELERDIELNFVSILDNNTHLMYGPNGQAFVCSSESMPQSCDFLTDTAKITLTTNAKTYILEFLPNNGFVSSNVN